MSLKTRLSTPHWQLILLFFLVFQSVTYAAGSSENVIDFFWIGLLLLIARLSSLVEKVGQPAVLGELVVGVLLGNLALIGINILEPIKHDEIILFLAELGVVILLFQIGLESNIDQMKKVGWRAFWVAVIGVAAPFGLGTYVIGPMILPGLSQSAYLFLGATLTATSVGITGRVLRDLNKLHLPEAQIILGAAVIDDVMGLIILAVVSSIVKMGSIAPSEVVLITLKAIGFLVAAIFIGQFIAVKAGRFFSLINVGEAMKFTLLVIFCLFFAYLAYLVGLAPIVGAFAAGLMLDNAHFKHFADPSINQEIQAAVKGTDEKTQQEVDRILERHSHRHLEDLIAPLGHFLVPLFFVMTGFQVKLETLFDPQILIVALAITLLAFFSKLIAGIAAGPVNKWIVGWGMAPRGEVGLIFAVIGKQLGVVSEGLFSAIVIMVILTTLLTPPILSHLLRKHNS